MDEGSMILTCGKDFLGKVNSSGVKRWYNRIKFKFLNSCNALEEYFFLIDFET